MQVLITGGAGFIGSALANRLAETGHDVRVLDDLSAGDSERLRGDVLFNRGDVRDIPKLWTLLRGVDCVYHLAARVSVPESILYPVEYNNVNVGGTVSLMTAARDAGVGRVILASSGTVYGEQEEQPIKETLEPYPPNPYAVSKLSSEYYVKAIGSQYDIQTVILRIFNAFGPHQPCPPSHPPVIPHFVKQTVQGGSVVVFGDGTQTRDFVYIDDVVEALAAAADAEDVDGAVINVGSGRETSIRELVERIQDVAGKRVSVLQNGSHDGGVSRSSADIRLARQRLGFVPRVGLDEGLERMLAHYREKQGVRGSVSS